MSDSTAAFDASLDKVIAAYRIRDAHPNVYDRAWADFYRHHFGAFLRQAAVYASRKGLRDSLQAVEDEIVERVLKNIRNGTTTNRKVLFKIRATAINEVWKRHYRLNDQDFHREYLRRLHEIGISDDARQRAMRARLEELIADVDAGHRSKVKHDLLRAILDDIGVKQNGEINLAEIARELGKPTGTINRAMKELRDDLPRRFPDLREYLEPDDELVDGQLIELLERTDRHDD